MKKKLLYFLYLFLITIIGLELLLRIFHPFHFRVKGDHILLDVNKTTTIENNSIPPLDKTIIHHRNGLGFRGPEKPDDLDKKLSLITIGGSTTECTYLSENDTWPDHLRSLLERDLQNTWLNNAGVAGHSTYGHIGLLKDHVIRLKPKLALFLVGTNDVSRDDLTDSDKSNSAKHFKNFFSFLSKKSELVNVIINLIRVRNAKTKNLADTYLNLREAAKDTLHFTGEEENKKMTDQQVYRDAFRKRLQTLIDLCKQNNIEPVFITQPTLVGNLVDSATGVDLAGINLHNGFNGVLWSKVLESYNDVTRTTAAGNNILCIDLARQLPKSGLYFYDIIHFTKPGAKRVAEIIYTELQPYLYSHYPGFKK